MKRVNYRTALLSAATILPSGAFLFRIAHDYGVGLRVSTRCHSQRFKSVCWNYALSLKTTYEYRVAFAWHAEILCLTQSLCVVAVIFFLLSRKDTLPRGRRSPRRRQHLPSHVLSPPSRWMCRSTPLLAHRQFRAWNTNRKRCRVAILLPASMRSVLLTEVRIHQLLHIITTQKGIDTWRSNLRNCWQRMHLRQS